MLRMGPTKPTLLLHPTRVRYGVLVFLCTLAMITYLDRVCISRVQEDIQSDLQIGSEQMGWIFTAFLIGYGLFEIPGGWMGDVWGSRVVLFRIVIWWSVFTALTGCVWAFPAAGLAFGIMVLVRFLFGAGEAGAFPNVSNVVGVWFPYEERGFSQGAIWMSARLGGAIAPVVIGQLTGMLGWRQAFWVLGGIGILWAVGFFYWFRDRPEDNAECNEAERQLIRSGRQETTPAKQEQLGPWQAGGKRPWSGEGDASASEQIKAPQEGIARIPQQQSLTEDVPASRGPSWDGPQETAEAASYQPELEGGHSWPPLRNLVGSLTLWAMCLASAGVSFGWYFYPTWQPRYLKDVHHISFANSEILTGLPFLCGALGCLSGGRLSDFLIRATGSRRWGRSLIGVIGFTGAGLCVLATGYTTAPWQAVVLLCLAFLINDLAIPGIWAVSADVGGRYVGTVAGIMNSAGAVGGMISPVMIPYVLGDTKTTIPAERWQIIFTILAGAWFIAAAAWFFIDASKPLFPPEKKSEI